MNAVPEVTYFSLLKEDELITLGYFVKLERWWCLNDNEVPKTQEEMVARIRSCMYRTGNMVASCIHAQKSNLGTLWARDVLNDTVYVFARLSSNHMEDKLMLYRDVLNLFDITRQGLEGNKYNLIEMMPELVLLRVHFPDDSLLDAILWLAWEVLHAVNLQKWDTVHTRFFLRFRSLKNEFSSTWEPQILGECQGYAQELLNYKPS